MQLSLDLQHELALTQNCTVCDQSIQDKGDRAGDDEVIEISIGCQGLDNPEIDMPINCCPKCGQWTRSPRLIIGNMIRWLVVQKTWGETAESTNNGNCDQFALDVQDRLEGIVDDLNEQDTTMYTSWEDGHVPAHVWVEWNGWFYDSECPDGVDEWTDLPIFKRFAVAGGEFPV